MSSPASLAQQSQNLRPVSVGEALQLTRQNAIESQAYYLEQLAFEAEARAVNQAFDTRLGGLIQKTHDDGPLNQLTYGDKRREDLLQTQLHALFPTGTSVELSASWVKQGVSFPFPTETIDPFNAPRFNPEHETLLGITARQSLMRNWMANEIRLSHQVLLGQAIEPAFQARIQIQEVQAEAEQLYWQLVGLNEQIGVAERLVEISKEFAKAMDQRRALGRSDDVDVADADSLVITRESDLLNLIVMRDQIHERLRVRLFGSDRSQNFQVPRQLPLDPPLALPAAQADQAISLAQQNRLDLQMLEKQRELSDEQVALAREKGRPDLGIFVSHYKRGLASELGDSLEDLSGGTITSIGLDLNWTLGQTERREQSRAASLRKQSLNYHGQVIHRLIEQNLRAAFERMRGAEQQRRLAGQHIQVLRQKRGAEERKLRQARSDEVAVQRYEIETLSAELQRIDAHLRIILASAEIRALLHAYPAATSTVSPSR